MKRAKLVLILSSLAATGAAGGVSACSSSGTPASTSTGDGGGDGSVAAASFKVELPCADTIASVYADPGDVSAKAKGAILRCAHDQDFTAAQLQAAVAASNDAGTPAYSGRSFTSGAHVYRVLYRTERGDPKNSPGYSSALVFLPDTPRAGAGRPLPVVLSAHGSRGQAGKCAPSLNDPAAADVEPDFLHQVYPLVGFGFPVIAPDNAGYANFGAPGNPPPAYDSVTDVGKSMLDGARALRALIPSSLTQQIVITGHSQGGYSALATLALADSYGADGVISAVAVYSPLWLSQRAFAGILLEPGTYGLDAGAYAPVSLWYHYTHSALLDGPDAALELFDPAKAAAVQSFVNNDCWNSSYPDLMAAGASANDFFSAAYVSAISVAASLGGGSCSGNQLCQTWIDRMTADYPHLTGGAAKVPVLLYYANNDTTITPDLMQCVINRLSTDNANYKVCYDTNPVGHGGVVAENADSVSDWIAQQTLPEAGAPQGGHCTALTTDDAGIPVLLGDGGVVIGCNTLVQTQ